MPTIRPRLEFAQLGTLAAQGPAALAEVAARALENLERWKPGVFPDRPVILTFDDGQIYEASAKRARGIKPTAEERDQLSYFGRWREAIWRVEGESASRLLFLLGIRDVQLAQDLHGDARAIALHVKEHWYGLVLPEVVPVSRTWRDRFAERACENRRLLPIWLRLMTRPPAGQYTRPNAKPEEPVPQQAFGYAEKT